MKSQQKLFKATALAAVAFVCLQTYAQSDTSLSLIGDIPDPVEKVQNAFKTTKVINLQSTEVTDAGVFDFKINHRFGTFNSGGYEAFGLDQANIRLGGEYGVIPNLMVGIGRTSVKKMVDAYLKYRFMHQTSDNKKPLSMLLMAGVARQTLVADATVSSKDKLAFSGQLIVGRKFNDAFSAELVPSWVRWNAATPGVKNDQFALGIGMRYKITNRTSINAEYIPVFGTHTGFYNSLSVGVDIETGGHVFQIQLTNSTGMIEQQFIARNDQSWSTGGIRLGFNISRVFTFVDPSRFKNNTY